MELSQREHINTAVIRIIKFNSQPYQPRARRCPALPGVARRRRSKFPICRTVFIRETPLQRGFSRPPTLGESISDDGAAGRECRVATPRAVPRYRGVSSRISCVCRLGSRSVFLFRSNLSDRTSRVLAWEKRDERRRSYCVRPFPFAAR